MRTGRHDISPFKPDTHQPFSLPPNDSSHLAMPESCHDESSEKEDWIISFVDILLLLLTLFALLFVYTKTQELPSQDEQTKQIDQEPTSSQNLDELHKELSAFEHLQVSVNEQTINLEINNSIMFQPGSANIGDEGLALLDQVITKLPTNYESISIEGHTDNISISTEKYPSNWELSSARASNVIRHLVKRGFQPEKLRAIGYADTRPISSNDTPVGREKNRRVSIQLHMKN